MNEYLFVLSNDKGSTDYRVINAVTYRSALSIYKQDKSCDDLSIEKVYVRYV